MSRTIEQRERGREKTRRWRAALSEEQRAAIRTQDRITAQARYHSLTVDEKAERLRKRAERRLAQRRAAGVSEETIILWAENAAKRRVTKTLGRQERLAQLKERQREAGLRWRTKRAARYRAEKVPADHGVRLDDRKRVDHLRAQAVEPDEDKPIPT